jgi:predicted transcriptional regulator
LTGFKRGDVFVTFWVALAVMAIVLLQQGIISRLPRELFLTMVQTVVILLMTYASKDLYIRNAKRRAEDATLMAVHFSAIYSHIERSGSIDNAACRQLCSLDRSRAHRLLQALEKEGLLRGAGQGDARMYTKSSVAG